MPQGIIIRSTGSWYEVLTPERQVYACRLRGKFKLKELKVTNPIAVGDEVVFELEDFNEEERGVISEILPRRNYLIRKSVHKTAHGHLIATNLDQAVVIATLTFPRTSLGFIDRFLVSAEAFRIPAVVVFNKLDLLDAEARAYQEEIVAMYKSIGYRCLLSSTVSGEGIEEFKSLLSNKKTLLSGHSGVGKSSLVNIIAPDLLLRTGEVSTFANKGTHTTTFAEMFEWQENSFLIDTPGIKELGLIDIEKEELAHFFPEMRTLLGQCKFHNCLHVHEPKCAVIAAVEVGTISLSRYENYLSMLQDYDNRR